MITNKVQQWREQKGVTKSILAHRVGLSRSYVTRLEKGEIKPSLEVMFRIARYLGCQIEEIFQYVDDGKHKGRNYFASNVAFRRHLARRQGTPICTRGLASPLCPSPATPPARPAWMESATDTSLYPTTAKAVALPLAYPSQKEGNETTNRS